MKALLLLSLVALCVADADEEAGEPAARAASDDPKEKRGPPPPPATAEKQEFQTDVRKMLDIIINSLYTNRNIFLRELISNAADALDKVRFLYLTQPKHPKSASGEEPSMDIRIQMDKEKHTLVIRDGGIGMTKEEMVNNLGKIGSSGTKQFLEKFQQAQGDISLIGQFGVGFYSAFLIADRIVVASKSDDTDVQYVWESSADGEYLVYEDPRGNTLGRGTEITLYLKEDADEFAEEGRVREIATRYSEFIHFPIFVWAKYDPSRHPEDKKEKKPKKEKKEKKEGEEEVEVEVEEEEKEEPKPEHEWLRMNENAPIWTRPASDVTEEEYKKFFKALTKDFDEPMAWDHFTAEGEVNFKSILYIPAKAPAKLFEGAQSIVSSIKLYVRRVFITDEFKDMLPRYLSFIAGVVDSDDLPLNVSRELLQENRVLKIIKKKLIRKILGMIKDIADKDADAVTKHKEAVDAAETDEAKKAVAQPTFKYPTFYEEYGKALRLGLIDDAANRARLSKLLRYKTTKTVEKGEWRSLEEYVDSMLEKQTEIYYIIGFDDNTEELAKKPFIQKFKKVGAEVILMTDPIDEYVVGHMTEFAGKKLVNLAKEDVKVPGEDEDSRKTFERRKTLNKDFTDWFRGVLGKNVEKVVLSERLDEAPAVVVSSKYGLTANMYNIMKGTPLGDQAQARSPLQKVLEVNINHPIIRKLRDASRATPEDQKTKDAATLIFETALFESGFVLEDMKSFVQRMQTSVGTSLGVESMAVLDDEELPPEEVAAADDDEEVDADAAEPAAGGDNTIEMDLSNTEASAEKGSDEL